MAADDTKNLETMKANLFKAAKAIQEAEVLMIFAGAGMGVASGLGTFRGKNAGIWPPLVSRKLEFPEMSCPARFQEDDYLGGPTFAWSFWKWRTDAYSSAPLTSGYTLLQKWASEKAKATPAGSFVYTSNIDGHFLRIPEFLDRVVECHGSISHLQCQRTGTCTHAEKYWPTPFELIKDMEVNAETDCVSSPLPVCQGNCGLPARPNVMMFGDWTYLEEINDLQHSRFSEWKKTVSSSNLKAVAIELGAGTAIPTVRIQAQSFSKSFQCPLIRINPEAPNIPKEIKEPIPLPLGATAALTAIEAILANPDKSREEVEKQIEAILQEHTDQK